MITTIKTMNAVSCAVVYAEKVIISDTQTALDFIMTIQYETGCDRIALNKAAIEERFFILSTGLAGEILQRFINYQIKLAIIGDFSEYTSKPLKDFIYECNKGTDIFFVSTEQQAVERLAHTNLPLRGRIDLREVFVPREAEDESGLTPGEDDNEAWCQKHRKTIDNLVGDWYETR